MQAHSRVIRLIVLLIVLSLLAVTATAQQNARRIIVFEDHASMNANSNAAFIQQYNLESVVTYNHVLNGMAAVVPAGRLRALRNDPRVAYMEEDLLMTIQVQTTPTGVDRSFASSNPNLSIDGSDERVDVDVAILDTGIDLQHPDLNVVAGIDCTLASGGGPFATRYCGTGNGGDDDHYHGTHVAGTVAALDNDFGVVGIAPGARLHAVKVLDSSGSGYTSGIIAGIDWVVAQGNIEVANMSLGGSGISTAYETAIDNAVAQGVTFVVAAGNSDQDANNYSPAFVPSAITVSALADFDGLEGAQGSPTCRADEDDTLANFSNWGSAVDIAAPGVCILSTYPLEQGEYASISGTSMAAPQVAGAAAVLASQGLSPAQIDSTLKAEGNYNWTDDSGDGILEPLLDLSNTSVFNPVFVGGSAGPVASFTSSCDVLSCSFDGSGSSGEGLSYAWDFGDGQTSSSAVTSNLYGASGTYTVTLTVSDGTDSDTATDTVTVSDGSGGGDATSVSVSDLDGFAGNAGRNWTATVVITVRDNTGAAVVGATVSGSFSTGNSVSCQTDASGSCGVISSSIRKGGNSSMSFTVSNVTGALPYDSAGNSDADGDSDGTNITVFR